MVASLAHAVVIVVVVVAVSLAAVGVGGVGLTPGVHDEGASPSSAKPPVTGGVVAELPPLRFPLGPSLEKLQEATPALPRDASVVNRSERTTTTTTTTKPLQTTTTTVTTPRTVTESRTPFIEPTKSAGVLVGVFVSVALLGYIGLLVWRRVLEKRYGNREVLVNEEELESERNLGSNFQL